MSNDFEIDFDYRSWSSLIDAWEREDRNALRRVAVAERISSYARESGVTDRQRRREASRRGQIAGRLAIAARRGR